ncbi:MAG: hypothetical protein JWQ35_2682 [Bacteriovoracaceae bacterium]|nr:hypothetical protein [Bacteriovoracaceae bacterium]
MKTFLSVWLGVILFSLTRSDAAVRTVTATERTITPIYLTLGKSTVLRFREKPKKVIVGNKNYFNIEFIENDLAIQPLGTSTTNLFVYAEDHTYGFSLHSNGNLAADDLIRVEWGSPISRQAVLPHDARVRSIGKQIKLTSQVQFRVEKIVSLHSKNLIWIEASLLSNERHRIRINEIKISLLESGKKIEPRFICGSSYIEPQRLNPCRIFLTRASDTHVLRIKFRNLNSEILF